jgi:hypothetical protein
VRFLTTLWTVPDPASSPATRFTRWGRIGAVTTLVLAAGFQLAAFIAEPRHPETIDRLQWIADNEARANVAKTCDFLAMPFLFGVVIVYVLLSRERSRRLSYAGGIILACGMVGLTAAQGYEILLFDLTQDGRFDLTDLADASDGVAAPGIAMFLLFLPGAVFGLLTMAVALWRSQAVPRAPVLLIPAFIILDIPLQQGLLAHAVAFVGACWIAAVILLAGRVVAPEAYPAPVT